MQTFLRGLVLMTLLQRIEARLVERLPVRIQARLLAAHVASKAIVRSAFWLILFVLAAKLIAAGKEMAVAYRYGTSAMVEGYLFVFNLLSSPVSLLFSVMSAVLIPHLVTQQREDPDRVLRWQRQVTAWVWLVAIVLGSAAALGLPRLLEAGWLGLDGAARSAALSVLPWLAGIVTCGIIAGWHACQLMSRQQLGNTFLEAMPALGVLIAVLAWPTTGGSAPLLWGTLLGFVLQVLLLIGVAKVAGAPIDPSWPPGRPFQRTMMSNASWLVAGQFIMGVAGVVDQVLLAHMSTGNLATYGYANRVMALVLTLSATVVGRAVLPVLANETDAALRLRLTRLWARRLFWLGAAGAAVLIAMAEPVVAALFERGSFTAADTEKTTYLLRLMALQWPLYLVGTIWAQWLLASAHVLTGLWWAALAGTASKIVTSFLLIGCLGWDAEAICVGLVAATLGYWIALRASMRALHREHKHER